MTNSETMFLEVTHPNGEVGLIQGFRFIWAFYVNGYNPEKHCQPGLKGSRVPDFCTGKAMSGRRVALDRMARYPYVYICGVASGPKDERKHKNLHLPLRYAHGNIEEATSYNGYQFRIENGERVQIPELEEGWQGKPREHTRCKNFRFAVGCFGYPPTGGPSNLPSHDDAET